MVEWVVSLAALLAAAAAIGVGLIVWFGEKKNYLRIPFIWLAVFVAIWIASNVVFAIGPISIRFLTALVSYGAAMLIAVQTFYFVQKLTHPKGKLSTVNRIYIIVGYCVAPISTIPGVIGVSIQDASIVTHSVVLVLYGVLLTSYLILACTWLITHVRKADRILKRQILLILRGVAISSVVGVLFNLILPAFGNYHFIQLGPAGAIVFLVVVAYAVARYSLFDVRLAIVRGVAYLATFATLTAVYLGVALLIADALNSPFLSADQAVLNIFAVLIMAVLLQPIKKFFDRLTNKVFYQDNYDTDIFFAQVNRALSSSNELRPILKKAAYVIANNLRSEQVSFFIYTVKNHHVTVGTEGHSQLAVQDVHSISDYVHERKSDDIIRASTLSKNDPMRRLMLTYRVEVIVPLMRAREGQAIGYMCLGDRRSGGYTGRDMRLLKTVVDELLLAIQNALAVQEVRDLNETLQQRIDLATKELRTSNAQLHRLDEAKDEFISMASHQLRTPLTSIKGYVSMLMEGDVGPVTKEQKHLLNEAFIGSERMVRLIGDFLNVSRVQTGKFVIDRHPVDLGKLVKEELEVLEPAATARGLSFSFTRPKNIPMLNIDENKIQQVIMNFSDNAMYYSKDESTIKVSLKVVDNAIEFTVKDTGIGVPIDQQEQLFTKFFRAANARKQRPDGTGVGLFLAKKVIDAHGGEIIFVSKENKGSTFGFRLPITPKR